MADSAQGHAADEDLNENGARGDANENDAGADDANENGARGDANENGAGGAILLQNGAGGDDNANEGLNPHDLRELQKFSNLVISRATEINKRLEKTSEMGTIGHWYDGKVPVNDKCLYNFVSLKTCTDKSHMSEVLKSYKVFYEELKKAGEALRKAALIGLVDADNILTLYNRASQMLVKAAQGKNATNSSILYAIHDLFIDTQEALENVIRRVECVALRQELKQVTKSWSRAIDEIRELKQDLQGARADNMEIQKRLDGISATSQEQKQGLDRMEQTVQTLRRENALAMAENQRILMEQNQNQNQEMALTVQILRRENEVMAQNQRILMEQNQIMTKLLKDFLDRTDDGAK